jgi:hypothetical protein
MAEGIKTTGPELQLRRSRKKKMKITKMEYQL